MPPADGPRCELCGRVQPLTEHHLLPRAIHRRQRFIERHGKAELQTRKLMVCRFCHSGIHDLIPSERELAENYNTREALLAHEGLRKHIAWVRKQK
jgi:hypothetical protein